jgi:rhodanese-related sulfurtransferase
MKITLVLLSVFIMISTSSLFGQNIAEERFESVSNDEFKNALQTGEYIVLDVRTVEDYQAGNIEGAKLLDYNGADFEQGLANIPKDYKYLIYSTEGVTSKKAMKRMEELGFKYVLELDKGIKEWK